ncbi:hypothetical protein [Anthocerotibacter panamensis]|uniref:hypothetical protein n=1 Tax=Anthocerotibacter panamensis TaxID=2857077 RepID=UPI001C401DDC|nr:hypothetical protein [Anthocerotibacter panamensis]
MDTYVAELQLHMALQARNLVSGLTSESLTQNPCSRLLHEAQVAQEIAFSRLS